MEDKEYFQKEIEFLLENTKYDEITIRRYHLREMEACELADGIDMIPELDFKIYTDKIDPRYSYIEVWKIKDRTIDYFEDLHREWDDRTDQLVFEYRQEKRYEDILKNMSEGMTKEELEKLIRKIEFE